MILRYQHLSRHERIFLSMTGLRLPEFAPLLSEVLPSLEATHHAARHNRPHRRRAAGAGHPFELDWRDQVLLCVVWMRQYPTQEVLGYLFGVSDTTVLRAIERVLPVLEASGRDTMRLPDPGKKKHRQLDDLLQDTPELAVLIDSFEQRVQRPKKEEKVAGKVSGAAGEQSRSQKDLYYSGKKKQHTLKTRSRVKWRWRRPTARSWTSPRAFRVQRRTWRCWSSRA